MGLTNFFYATVWGVFVLLVFFYLGIVCTLLYRMLLKGERRRALKKLLMGFSLFLLLGVYEMVLLMTVGGGGQLVSVPVLGAKLFICSTFFVLVFLQSAGFVGDSLLYCGVFQLAVTVVMSFIDILYWAGLSGDDGYRLWLACVVFLCMVLFMGKLFYVCFKRYDTLVQILNKESLIEAGLNISALFMLSYFMMMGLLAKSGIFLGAMALLLLAASHLYVLSRFNITPMSIFSRRPIFGQRATSGQRATPGQRAAQDSAASTDLNRNLEGAARKKSYMTLKVESSGDDMLMDCLPVDDYKIIQRLILHFELKKPFLDSDLKMDDVTKQIYTNRSYLSRALNHRLSKNFNQFVNYYRVKEACSLYIGNPELKGRDLAKMCGFKNLSSFSTAFSIHLRYTPGEWCKEVKRRLNNNEEVSVKDYFS